MGTNSADAYSVAVASCLVCGDPATPAHRAESASEAATELAAPPTYLPRPDLCEQHWTEFNTDWLLLGWCVDHYGQALTVCPAHNREIEPL